MIERILSRPEFVERPPVLVEVGASGGTHAAWRGIARWSICVAFDPDSREMKKVEDEATGYRTLHILPAAAIGDERTEAEFHLTRSPFCSSLLPPDQKALADWDFAALFEVDRTANVRCRYLPDVLRELNLPQVDWFKSDSQGTDLRLFQSLGDEVCRRVLSAEFEPGIINAYVGEEKLAAVLSAMDRPEFWVSDLQVLGTLRIPASRANRWSEQDRELARFALPRSPGWVEMTCLNTFRGAGPFGVREWLLGWVIATEKRQHGFALDLAERAAQQFPDPVFRELAGESELRMENDMRRARTKFNIRRFGKRLREFVRRKLAGGS